MHRYIIQRLLLSIPTFIGATMVVFLMVRAVPGDVADQLLGEYGAANPEVRAAILKKFSLDDNIAQQYLTWAWETARLDFGTSIISGRSVSSELGQRLPVTVELGILAIIVSLVIAIPVGILSAIRQDSAVDYIGRSISIGALAIPDFWIAIVIITVASRWDPFGWDLKWAVPGSYTRLTDDPIANLKFMAMPAFLLGSSLSGSVSRFTRSSMLEVLRQDYVRTAWAKGLRERVVITNHALKNSLIPVVTVVGLQLPLVVGGAVVIETVYSIPGIGRYYILGINTLDYPVIQAIVMMAAVVVIFGNLAVDLMYSALDPRIRFR
ncbi:MAG: ABC transporter permease [Dehalococcoidia bacterium]|nr:ABC transporter permease [Dehalococcoidia bacterium]MCA9823867.1 ABC transporter permease [Dehalococcoidia bacterium]MCA9844573.1 ABC transporter permease [Dehalococcoidia bacterium]